MWPKKSPEHFREIGVGCSGGQSFLWQNMAAKPNVWLKYVYVCKEPTWVLCLTMSMSLHVLFKFCFTNRAPTVGFLRNQPQRTLAGVFGIRGRLWELELLPREPTEELKWTNLAVALKFCVTFDLSFAWRWGRKWRRNHSQRGMRWAPLF